MADRFDIVTIRIEHKRRIIMWVIMGAKPGRSVLTSASGYGSGEERIDIRPRGCIESEVDTRRHWSALG